MTAFDSESAGLDAACRVARHCLGPAPSFSEPMSGTSPLVERQWAAALADAALFDTVRAYYCRLKAIADLYGADSLGKVLPRAARLAASSEMQLAESFRQLAWFEPPASVQRHWLREIYERCSLLANDVRVLLETNAHDGWQLLRSNVETWTRELFESAPPYDSVMPPWALYLRLLELEPEAVDLREEHPLASARAQTPLNGSEVEALSRKVAGDLLPATARWVPDVGRALAALVLSERPLIARRAAEAAVTLLMSAAAENLLATARALANVRERVGESYASHTEITDLLAILQRAQDSGNQMQIGLAAGRLYAATIEGPVSRAGTATLQLLKRPVADDRSLAEKKDQLDSADNQLATDLGYAIKPEWRNAVDHREMRWDARAQKLSLRGESVDVRDVLRLQQIGLAAADGLEVGISIACSAVPGLLEAIEQLAPQRTDHISVEHHLRDSLAAQGVTLRSLRTEGTQLYVSLHQLEDVSALLAVLRGDATEYSGVETIAVDMPDQEILFVDSSELRRSTEFADATTRQAYGILALASTFANALIALGVPPTEALNRCASAVAGHVMHRLTKALEAGVSTAELARAAYEGARDARKLVEDIERVAHCETPEASRLKWVLSSLATSAAAYERGLDTPDGVEIRTALRTLESAQAEMGPPNLPWFTA